MDAMITVCQKRNKMSSTSCSPVYMKQLILYGIIIQKKEYHILLNSTEKRLP